MGEALGCWAAAVALAVVFGAGRATWEGNFKSSVADDFHDDHATAAFANVTVQSGLASTLGFLLNAHAPPRLVATIVVASSGAGDLSQAVAAKIRSNPQTTYAATDVVGVLQTFAPAALAAFSNDCLPPGAGKLVARVSSKTMGNNSWSTKGSPSLQASS